MQKLRQQELLRKEKRQAVILCPKQKTVILLGVALVAVLAVSAWLLLPRNRSQENEPTIPVDDPAWHYNQGIQLIQSGDYMEAYRHLYRCVGYENSYELLQNFMVYAGSEKYQRTGNGGSEDPYYIEGSWERSYDSDGRLEKELWYRGDRIILHREHSYDAAANKEELVDYENGEIVHCSTIIYDAAGNETERINYAEDGRIVYHAVSSYDEAGNKTEYKEYSRSGECIEHYKYTYDSHGNITEAIESGEYQNMRSVYTYDAAGNLLKEIRYNEKGNITYHSEYTYDVDGFMTASKVYEEFEGISRDSQSTYSDHYVFYKPVEE